MHSKKAIQLALEAEPAGNEPEDSIIVLEDPIISTGINLVLELSHSRRQVRQCRCRLGVVQVAGTFPHLSSHGCGV